MTSNCKLLLASLSVVLSIDVSAGGEVEKVIRAQRATVGLIHAMSATFTIRREVFNNQTLSPPEIVRVFRWAIDDGTLRERQVGRIANLPQDKNGFVLNCYDIYQDRDSSKGLLNWDWKRSQPLVPSSQGPVRAQFGTRDQLLRGQALHPRCLILFDVQADNADTPRSLEFLLSNPDLVESGPVESGGLIKIVAKYPGFASDELRLGWREEYFFDPHYGNLLREFRVLMQGVGGAPNFVLETQVKQFQSFGDGVCLPSELLMSFQDDSGSRVSLRERTTLTDIQINDDVQDEEFNFRFPENCLVTNQEIPKDGPQDRYELYLWGPDNKPAQKLTSATELAQFDPVGVKPKSSVSVALVFAATVMLVAFIGLVAFMKSRRSFQ